MLLESIRAYLTASTKVRPELRLNRAQRQRLPVGAVIDVVAGALAAQADEALVRLAASSLRPKPPWRQGIAASESATSIYSPTPRLLPLEQRRQYAHHRHIRAADISHLRARRVRGFSSAPSTPFRAM